MRYLSLFKSLAFIALSGFWVNSISAQKCNVQDSIALTKLFQATGGSFWAERWRFDLPVMSWYGVRLSPEGRVVALTMQSNNMSGSIPVLNLPELKMLSLGFNQLSGTLPSFATCPKLHVLYLASNKLSGTIPSFAELSNLEELNLSVNQFTGSVPDFKTPNLRSLNLSANALTGTLLGTLNLPFLQRMVITDNKISGTIPDFTGLFKLEELTLSGNALTNTIPNFTGLPRLRTLVLSRNKLSGSLPDFTRLAKLTRLALDHNEITGKIPEFTYLPELKFMDLSYNKMTGPVPTFASLPHKETINISYNKFTFDGIEQHLGLDKSYNLFYNNQDSIKVYRQDTYLYVDAGGTEENVYACWYRNDTIIANVVKGNGSLLITSSGRYRCVVKNSGAPSTILTSKVLDVKVENPEQLAAKTVAMIVDMPKSKVISFKNGDTFNLTVPQMGNYIVQVFDKDGKKVMDQNHYVAKRRVISFPINGLIPGVYQLRLTGGSRLNQVHNITIK